MENKIIEIIDKLTVKLGAMEPTAIEAFTQLVEREVFRGYITFSGFLLMTLLLFFAQIKYKSVLWDWDDPFPLLILGIQALFLTLATVGLSQALFPLASLLK